MMFVAYVLALAALERAEAAPVAALRETSVVMAAIGAAVWGRARVPADARAGRGVGRGGRRRDRSGVTPANVNGGWVGRRLIGRISPSGVD